jgi:hypothetical protein
MAIMCSWHSHGGTVRLLLMRPTDHGLHMLLVRLMGPRILAGHVC